MIKLTVNGKAYEVDVPADMPVLWVIRDKLGLTGTKYGCGAAQCGACTVHLNGDSIRSCITPVSRADGQKIITIEAMSEDAIGQRLQKAWMEEDVPQCGYCQSGQIMAAAVLLQAKPKPTDTDIDLGMSGNICRCGTYQSVRKAIHRAAEMK